MGLGTTRRLMNKAVLLFQCPCFYALSRKSLPLLDTFMQEKKVRPTVVRWKRKIGVF